MHQAAELSIHRAAESHVSVAQQIAPRDTGLMADTTHKEPTEPSGSDASSYVVIVEAPQIYSGFVEFGTSKMEAQPWFLPAFESAKRQLFSEAAALVNIVLSGGRVGRSLIQTGSVRQRPAIAAKRK